MSEEWRPVVGYEGAYEVSDQGRVRGLDRFYMRHGYPVRVRARVLKLLHVQHGYRAVSLGRNRRALVHRLVLEAFVGPAPEGMEGCHNDGDPANNHVGNLRWDTHAENVRDTIRHGRHPNQRKTHCVNGHEFTPANTVPHDGDRRNRACLTCRREAMARFLERQRKARAESGITRPWLSDEVKEDIERRLAAGQSGNSIARELGVSGATVSRIRNGRDLAWNERKQTRQQRVAA